MATYYYTATSSTSTADVWVFATDTTSATTYDTTAVPFVETLQEQRRREQRQREIREQRRAAAEKGRILLLALLDDDQRQEFETRRQFTVISQSGKRYEVTHRLQHGTFEIGQDGQRVTEFCIVPRTDIPVEDHMLAQKLMLEADEDRFLKIANATRLRRVAA